MKKYTSNIIITLLLLLGILSAVLAIKYDNTYLFNCLLFFTALSKGKNIWEELIYKFRKPTDELRIPMRFDSGRNFFGWIGIILFLMGGGIHFHDWYWNIFTLLNPNNNHRTIFLFRHTESSRLSVKGF